MFLDERSAGLLKLLQHSSIPSMNEMEQQTGLTRRQIQYSLGKVNDWLESNGYAPVQYKRDLGYFLSDQIADASITVKLTKRSYIFFRKGPGASHLLDDSAEPRSIVRISFPIRHGSFTEYRIE